MFWKRVAFFLLRRGGWTAVGGVPDVHKAVIVGAPHTSNWDGFWALVYIVAFSLDVSFFIKKSMFWFPLNVVLRGLGAIPLDRNQPSSAVKEVVDDFNSGERFLFGLTPEGTRGKTAGWKSGFYRIAEDAGVPVVLAFFDYGKKRLGMGPTLTLTGDRDADLAIIRSFYESVEGRHPEKTCPVEFIPARKTS